MSPLRCRRRPLLVLPLGAVAFAALLAALPRADTRSAAPPRDGRTLKAVLPPGRAGKNLLAGASFVPFGAGFRRDGKAFVCDNGADPKASRGLVHVLALNQTRPAPIVASARSKARAVSGEPDADYAVYLDLLYADGTPLYGQAAAFGTGSHDWERRQVVVVPGKPVKQVSFHLLLRWHGGKAWFSDPELRVLEVPEGACHFDGVLVAPRGPPVEGFQVRDVGAGSDFVRIERRALGLQLEVRRERQRGATFFDVVLSDRTGKDRAVTLLYAVPVAAAGLRWLEDPRRSAAVRGEMISAEPFHTGAGRLSRYPLGAVEGKGGGLALGIDMARPAFFRVGCNAGTGELFLAYDVALTEERPSARLRFCRYEFPTGWGFRSALARYYDLFPDAFRCRTPEQGLWMPFAPISKVKGWRDFGFKFKQGTGETRWDDGHGILTFRATEPMTWWMPMSRGTPRTPEAALADARRLAARGVPEARALFTSGYFDERGRLVARLVKAPWCDGAVWSMNSMPGVRGGVTDFKVKWNDKVRERYYGPGRKGDLDGEYIDSSEGYQTDQLDFRRAHFAGAATPLCFSRDARRPAIFRGLIAFEYARAVAADIRRMGKLMMANGTPTRLCWLAPLLDVMGTEVDWHPGGRWVPMSDADLLYRRALTRGNLTLPSPVGTPYPGPAQQQAAQLGGPGQTDHPGHGPAGPAVDGPKAGHGGQQPDQPSPADRWSAGADHPGAPPRVSADHLGPRDHGPAGPAVDGPKAEHGDHQPDQPSPADRESAGADHPGGPLPGSRPIFAADLFEGGAQDLPGTANLGNPGSSTGSFPVGVDSAVGGMGGDDGPGGTDHRTVVPSSTPAQAELETVFATRAFSPAPAAAPVGLGSNVTLPINLAQASGIVPDELFEGGAQGLPGTANLGNPGSSTGRFDGAAHAVGGMGGDGPGGTDHRTVGPSSTRGKGGTAVPARLAADEDREPAWRRLLDDDLFKWLFEEEDSLGSDDLSSHLPAGQAALLPAQASGQAVYAVDVLFGQLGSPDPAEDAGGQEAFPRLAGGLALGGMFLWELRPLPGGQIRRRAARGRRSCP